jgi:GNAT superfamily N-acetyltransferase
MDQVLALYRANGWSAANRPDQLMNALKHSHSLISAWIEDRLVGLGNAISDGYLVVYYPILPEYQGQGIGAAILARLKENYTGFHQHILVADGRAIEFYNKNGFQRAGNTQSMWIYSGKDHS